MAQIALRKAKDFPEKAPRIKIEIQSINGWLHV